MTTHLLTRGHSRRALLRGATIGAASLGLAGFVPAAAYRAAAHDATPEATPAQTSTPAADQFRWFLGTLQGGTLTASEINARFSPLYLAASPSESADSSDDVIERVKRLAQTLDQTVFQDFVVPPDQTPNQVYGVLARADSAFLMIMTVEPDAPHRILDVLTLPLRVDLLTAPPAPPATWQAFEEQLRDLAPEASFLAAEVVGDELRPIHAFDADRQFAVGSTYKLYILGELGRQIAAGEAAWDESLAIRNDWKSLPADPLGDPMAYDPAGTKHTLREYAEQMISVSSNTAADHLLFTVGRERVEAILSAMGHGQPDRNMPLLATREMFALNVALPADQLTAYLGEDTHQRRETLDTSIRPMDIAPVQAIDWVAPRHLSEIGWFASTSDACRAMAVLRTQAQRPEEAPVLDILALNTGLNPALIEPAAWTYIGHKGGALPGGINRTWLLQRADGRWFVFSATLNNPEAPLDLVTPDPIIAGAFTLLANAGTGQATPAR